MENVTITMSRDDWSKLTCYILMNTKARQEELDACIRLSEEKDANGELVFPNMESRVEFTREQNSDVDRIREVIDDACCKPQIGQARMEELMTLMKDGLIEDDEEQAYIYFKETCDMNFLEANFLGLEFDKWEEYNGISIFEEE